MAEASGDARVRESIVSDSGLSSGLPSGSTALARAARPAVRHTGAFVRGIEFALGASALAAGGYIFVSTILMAIRCWTTVPYWDQWDTLILSPTELYFHTIPLDLPHWLFYQHNEHRILVPRLIFMIDRFLFATTNKFNFFCNVAIQLGLAALMIRIATRTAGQRIAEKIWIVGAVLALLFSAMQWENLLWGFQVQFLGVDLAALATFATLASGRASVARLAAAIALESIATYTLSSGMAVPFIAIPLAIWVRWPPRHVAILSLTAFALLASYLYGYHTPAFNDDPARSIWQLREVVIYVFNEIGNPFGLTFAEAHLHHPLTWTRLCGAVGVIAVVGLTIDMVRRGERNGPVPILIAVALFSLGMMLLTALGRLKFGLALSSRYSSPVLLFWTALIVIAMIRVGPSDVRLRIAAMAAMLPVLLGLALFQPAFAALGRAWTLPRLEATTALLANVDDPEALVRVYPVPAVPRDRAPLLRQRHLSIFSEEWADWLGTPLADHTRLGDLGECQGGINGVEAVGVTDSRGWRANGWVWDPERRTAPRRIVIADADGRVVGYGLSGFPGGSKGSAWRGHLAVTPPASIAAYALLDNGRTACPLGRWPALP